MVLLWISAGRRRQYLRVGEACKVVDIAGDGDNISLNKRDALFRMQRHPGAT